MRLSVREIRIENVTVGGRKAGLAEIPNLFPVDFTFICAESTTEASELHSKGRH